MNEQYVKIRKDLMETYKMALNRTSFKLLVEATNKFINTFSNSTTKATKNYSMKDFFTMLSVCQTQKEFTELFDIVEELVDEADFNKLVIGIYSPTDLKIIQEEFEEWGDDEDKEYLDSLNKNLKPMYKELKYQYMV